ncbi:hypothetical protein OF83DRAFT_625419 [Amylostereum chailletii]|nr:hypothetical protein OF83DRAFT_625419 [Amylostereum chailletii]
MECAVCRNAVGSAVKNRFGTVTQAQKGYFRMVELTSRRHDGVEESLNLVLFRRASTIRSSSFTLPLKISPTLSDCLLATAQQYVHIKTRSSVSRCLPRNRDVLSILVLFGAYLPARAKDCRMREGFLASAVAERAVSTLSRNSRTLPCAFQAWDFCLFRRPQALCWPILSPERIVEPDFRRIYIGIRFTEGDWHTSYSRTGESIPFSCLRIIYYVFSTGRQFRWSCF